MIGRQDAVKFVDGLGRFRARRLAHRSGQGTKTRPDHPQTLPIVFGDVMGHAAGGVVQMRAAETLLIDGLAGRALHQIRPAQPHETRLLHHQDHVAQRRQISAARDTGPHDGRDLRHMQFAPHERVVVEDPARAVLARKDAVLIGQVDTRRIHQIDNRHAVPHGDLLGAQDFGDRLRPPGPGFHGGIVRDHHRGTAFDTADTGHHTGGRSLPVVLVISHQQADFNQPGLRVEQLLNPLARGQFSGAMLLFDLLRTAALSQPVL